VFAEKTQRSRIDELRRTIATAASRRRRSWKA
jgi:hypothetical protein